MKDKTLKIVGLGLTILGAGVSVASSIVGGKQQEKAIADAVKKEVSAQLNK